MNGRGNSYLVDSNIFIYHLNGDEIASKFLIDNRLHIAISRITFFEVLSYNYSEEDRVNIQSYLKKFEIVEINEKLAYWFFENRKCKKMKLADNIIASTAQTFELTLVTRNTKDFLGLDIEIYNPFGV